MTTKTDKKKLLARFQAALKKLPKTTSEDDPEAEMGDSATIRALLATEKKVLGK